MSTCANEPLNGIHLLGAVVFLGSLPLVSAGVVVDAGSSLRML